MFPGLEGGGGGGGGSKAHGTKIPINVKIMVLK